MAALTHTLADKIAGTVLYEGYILYPYRATPRKNRERFAFGRVYPAAYNDSQNGIEACVMQTQCLAKIAHGLMPRPHLHGRVAFLQPMKREICEVRAGTDAAQSPVVQQLTAGGQTYETWLEAVEREVQLPEVSIEAASSRVVKFAWEASRNVEPLRGDDGELVGFIRRRQRGIQGEISITVEPACEEVAKITVQVRNLTPMRPEEMADQEALVLATFASAHTILEVQGGEFVSLIDPPAECALASIQCENIGTWPVLVGDEEAHERTTMLSSPVILYDYPKIAPEQVQAPDGALSMMRQPGDRYFYALNEGEPADELEEE
jgi:hypothetical protein